MKVNHLGLVLLGGLVCSASLSAQSVTTEPVGFTTNTLLGNSDSFITLPFIRPAAFVGGIQSAGGTTITVSGSPWTANQFVYAAGSQPNHYYALIGAAPSANAKEGHTYPIVSNTANTITVDLGPDNLTGIPANAQLSVIPNWSLATAFPPSDQNVSFTPSASSAQFKTQVRVPDVSAPGINPPYATYFFINNGAGNVGWRLVGNDTVDRGDDPLLPDSHFVVRNLNGAPTLPLVSLGTVLSKKVTVPLLTGAAQQDNPVGILRPLDVPLNATGLKLADGSFTSDDQLLLFNNAVAGYDKQPAIYVQTASSPNGPWRLFPDLATDRGNDVIPSGTGFVVRKAASNGQPNFWTNSFPVQAVSAASRKTHGSAGDFDVPLPLTGTPGVESRGVDGTYKIVFTFPKPVTVSGASVTSGTASAATTSGSGASEVTVNVTGATDVQRLTVTLLDVNDGTNTNNVAVRMGILTGDVNNNGGVSAADVSQLKSFSGQTLTATNFRGDVNLSGTFSAADVALVKSKAGSTLPANTAEENGRLTASILR